MKVRLNWIDLLVVAATSLVFTAAFLPHRPPPGPPTAEQIQEVAQELGVTADQLRRASADVPPPPRGARQSDEQRAAHHRALAAALAVPAARVDAVFSKFGPPRRD